MKEKTIDIHTHLLSKDLSFDRLYDKIALHIFAKKLGGDKNKLIKGKYQAYEEMLINNIKNSNTVKKIVLLPVDGQYTNDGNYVKKDETVCSSNDDIYEIYSKFPEQIVPFLSVNPNRKDALDIIDKYASLGFQGVKFLQNYWNININDKKYIPYFEKIKEYDLPIIIHTGSEYAVESNSMYEKIEVANQAIEMGCKVVLAHAGVSMFMEKNPLKWFNNFKMDYMCDDYYKMIKYLENNPNVYIDLSAIIALFRSKLIKDLAYNQKHIHNQILFGTDFPVPFSILFSYHDLSWKKRIELEKIENPFDRYIAFLNEYFESDSVIYSNWKKIIKG